MTTTPMTSAPITPVIGIAVTADSNGEVPDESAIMSSCPEDTAPRTLTALRTARATDPTTVTAAPAHTAGSVAALRSSAPTVVLIAAPPFRR
ncbi:hypothetical protein MUN33_00985 [Corynebacterium sp. LD5P10]|uniref:Uncharacterized protein n=1 Tax=Corynebacterium kalidii TaxID=2931982 RepID=A0A9X1WJ67_9CORY|nr:hypothetical protein [Corynebacterium kalidii]